LGGLPATGGLATSEEKKGHYYFSYSLATGRLHLFVWQNPRPGLGLEEKTRGTIAKAEEMAKLFM